MPNIPSLPPRSAPRVTFSALVDVLTQPSHRLVGLLKKQKYPNPGPVFGYKKAREQLSNWAVNGTPPNLQDPALRDHEVDALTAAIQVFGTGQALLPDGATSASKPGLEQQWSVNGVDISVFPDLVVSGDVRGTPATGAVKFFLRKDPTTVGPTLAALIYYHRRHIIQDPDIDPSLCAVVDVQAGEIYAATGSYRRLVSQIESSCTLIAAVWASV